MREVRCGSDVVIFDGAGLELGLGEDRPLAVGFGWALVWERRS